MEESAASPQVMSPQARPGPNERTPAEGVDASAASTGAPRKFRLSVDRTLFMKPAECKLAWINAIKIARTEILMAVFFLTEIDIVKEVLAALERGVEVYVLYDTDSLQNVAECNNTFRRLQQAGAVQGHADPDP